MVYFIVLDHGQLTLFVEHMAQHPQSCSQFCDRQKSGLLFVFVVRVGHVFNLLSKEIKAMDSLIILEIRAFVTEREFFNQLYILNW